MLTTAAETARPGALGRLTARLYGIDRLFLFTVVVPTLIATIYFGLIASDVYISESRFVVRSPQRQETTGIGSLLQGAGFSRSEDDTYLVHDFMLSRDALQNLDGRLGIRRIFGRDGVDPFSRYPMLGGDNSFEDLYRYYQRHVEIDTDSSSSISTLKVRTFTAQDSYRINEQLLEMSEQLVNQLNERAREDMIRFASDEAEAAERKARDAALAVSAYRNHNAVVDPDRQSTLQLQQVSKLQDELLSTTTQLVQLRAFTPQNPQLPALQKRADTLQVLIKAESDKITGGADSLADKAAQYESLALESAFADKQLAVALASLEQARNDAMRKQLYLERVVQPNKPDIALEPRRLRGILTTLVLGLMAWGVLAILLAGVREHKG